MKKFAFVSVILVGFALMFTACGQKTEEVNVRMDLTKQSTLEKIIASGELRHGFEAGYMPFEMTDKNGEFIGFDIDMGKKMAEALGVKWVPINTAWDGIIPSLMTDKFDIIMSGMTVTQERNIKINQPLKETPTETKVDKVELKKAIQKQKDFINGKFW